MEEITEKNCGKFIDDLCKQAGISRRKFADILGVAPSQIFRIENDSAPSEEFMNRLRALQIIGLEKFSKLKPSDKKKAAEAARGNVLTATGILAGLTALGTAKLAVGAAIVSIPILGPSVLGTGLLGYGIIKGIEKLCEKNKLSCNEKDGKLEVKKKQ